MVESVVDKILGGLSLELQERFPTCSVAMGKFGGEPVIKFQACWIMVDDGKFKVVVLGGVRPPDTIVRRVLFECSFVEPDADFESLFKFLQKTDESDGV